MWTDVQACMPVADDANRSVVLDKWLADTVFVAISVGTLCGRRTEVCHFLVKQPRNVRGTNGEPSSLTWASAWWTPMR
jgi:hypothetical protein